LIARPTYNVAKSIHVNLHYRRNVPPRLVYTAVVRPCTFHLHGRIRVLYKAVYGPHRSCARLCTGRVYGAYTAVYTVGRVHGRVCTVGRIHGRVYCRPCTPNMYTAVYGPSTRPCVRLCTGRVHGGRVHHTWRVHGGVTAVYTRARVERPTRPCNGRHTPPCTRP